MSISTTLEFWNEPPDPDSIHVITHCRKKFYNGKDISWYEFLIDEVPIHKLDHEGIIPNGFLRVDDTDYYEFAGTTETARKILTENGFTLIIKGNKL